MFNKIFTNKQNPKNVAKDRLKLILIHDRGTINPDIIDKIKDEILEVISKYVEIESGDVDISISNSSEETGEAPALIANIPIKHLKAK